MRLLLAMLALVIAIAIVPADAGAVGTVTPDGGTITDIEPYPCNGGTCAYIVEVYPDGSIIVINGMLT